MRLFLLALLYLVSPAGSFAKKKSGDFSSYACPHQLPELQWEKNPEKSLYRLVAPRNLKEDYPAMNPDGSVNMVVEVPAGCMDKWETDDKGKLFWDIQGVEPRFYHFLPPPGNYGMIPRTLMPLKSGGDGDPLDVLLLGRSEPRGAVVKVRLLGVLKAMDSGQIDDKLLAVPFEERPDNPFFQAKTAKDLPYGVSEIVVQWFSHYKGRGRMNITDIQGPKKAEKVLKEASHEFEELQKLLKKRAKK